jgi:hypothetical protein
MGSLTGNAEEWISESVWEDASQVELAHDFRTPSRATSGRNTIPQVVES